MTKHTFSWINVQHWFAMGKFGLALTTVVLLVVPINIYRAEIGPISSDSSFEMTLEYFVFKFHHHFCAPPKPPRRIFVTQEEIWKSLNLPKETQLSSPLMNFGECRAKSAKIQLDPSFCLCKFRWSYAVVFLLVLTAVFAEMVHFGWIPWKEKYFFADLFFRILVCSLIFGATITSFESIWVYEMHLPNESKRKNYFEMPILWFYAIVLCVIYGILTIVQITSLDFRTPTETEDYFRDEERDTAAYCYFMNEMLRKNVSSENEMVKSEDENDSFKEESKTSSKDTDEGLTHQPVNFLTEGKFQFYP